MGRKKQTKHLKAYLNGMLVGTLKKETSGLTTFQYDLNWLEEGIAISNSLPLQEDEYRGEVVTRYFDNLLPDNDEIKKIVATKFGAESTRSFDMLHAIGKDCVGALSFLSEDRSPEDFTKIDYSELTEPQIAARLRGLGSSTPLGMERDEDFRISIAGAQEKTAFLKMNEKWCEPHGLTPTTHILKTSIGALGNTISFSDSIDNEWVSLKIMQKMGLPTCEAHIEEFEDQRVLVVKRFDRKWETIGGKKVLLRKPQEDMCQALGISPYQKYQSDGGPGMIEISKLLMTSKNEYDRFQFFKCMIIFDLLFATDGHAKNFSIFLQKDGLQLTPFYDVMSAYFMHRREKVPLQKMKLAMKVGKSGHYAFKRINLKHYKESAKLCGIAEENFEHIIAEVNQSYQHLSFEKNELDQNVNQDTVAIILEGMQVRAKELL